MKVVLVVGTSTGGRCLALDAHSGPGWLRRSTAWQRAAPHVDGA